MITIRINNDFSVPVIRNIDDNSILIGRSRVCDIVINHPCVSRTHLRIYRLSDGRYNVRDNDTLNGTTYGGLPVSEEIYTAPATFNIGGDKVGVTITILPPGNE